MGERFVSKRDTWLVVLLWGASLLDFGIGAGLLLVPSAEPAFVAPLLLVAGVFQLHTLYGTDYRFDGDVLRIRASVFRWCVPLAAIDSVEPTRNPLSSPACSLDRLLVRYGTRRIMISPADKPGFLRTLATHALQLDVHGDHARRRAEA